jgi:predicted kinase
MRPVKESKLVVIIGPPGSGKTALLDKYPGYVRFDNDRVIEAVWGSLQYHAAIKRMAKGMVREGLRRAMEAGLAVVVPISGRTPKERSRIIDIGRQAGYHITVVRAVATAEECLERCKADPERPKSTDWKPIVDRWFEVFEPVKDSECDVYEEIEAI